MGIINKNSTLDRNLIRSMNNKMSHRGPDDENYYFNRNCTVGLAFRRLSIIDLKTGNQPMSNEKGDIQIIFNGEIYNYKMIRKELESMGHVFMTLSDTECIIHGYEEYGENIFSRLNGMFAIAIWDERKKPEKLVLARDRSGEKPVHYFLSNNTFIFASEIKSILMHPEVYREICWEGFEEYFAYGYIAAPLTIYHGIKKMEPGHYLTFSNFHLEDNVYWELDVSNTFEGDIIEAQEECLNLFEDAVKIRMNSDVPLGGFLSGGIDSSAICAIMAKNSTNVKTFSIGFENAQFDERGYAKKVANHLGTSHEEFIVTLDNKKDFKKIMGTFDEPFSDASAIPTFMLAKLAKKYVTVALSGDGGDELFGGYKTYRYMLNQIKKVNKMPIGYLRSVFRLMSHLIPPDNYIGKRLWIINHSEPERFVELLTVFNENRKMELFNRDLKHVLLNCKQHALLRKLCYFNKNLDFSKLMQYSDYKHYLADNILVKVDRTTMLASLESRAPFLDHRLVEFGFSLPSEWKINLTETKKILKSFMTPFLPKEIIEREKMGFGVPIHEWFREKLIDYYQEELLSSDVDNLFNRKTIKRYLKEHKSGKINRGNEIWMILIFLLWLRSSGI